MARAAGRKGRKVARAVRKTGRKVARTARKTAPKRTAMKANLGQQEAEQQKVSQEEMGHMGGGRKPPHEPKLKITSSRKGVIF